MRNDLPNLLNSVMGKESITELINDYEMMINTKAYNNVRYKDKVQEYINKVHLRLIRIKDKNIRDKYDKNEYFVYQFKKKLVNLLSNPDSREYFEGVTSPGIDEYGKKRKGKI